MPTYQFINYLSDNGLITITINRPPYNVLDIVSMEEMGAALHAAAADPTAKLVLITGSGEKAFSAGVEVADHAPDKVERMIQVFGDIFRHLEAIPIPTVAALNGVALGGGCELAIGCDMVVAAAHAKIGQPEIKLGVFPPIAAALLAKLIPPGKAYELVLGGESLSADEALRWGLVNKVYAKEEYTSALQSYLAQFLGLSRIALMFAKKAMRAARDHPFLDGLARSDAIYLHELMATEDAQEGLAAFMQKRKPMWKNK